MFTYSRSDWHDGHAIAPGRGRKFLKKYKTTLFKSYGVVKKDYVTVPGTLLKNTKELKKYLELSHGYVATLKPQSNRHGVVRFSVAH